LNILKKYFLPISKKKCHPAKSTSVTAILLRLPRHLLPMTAVSLGPGVLGVVSGGKEQGKQQELDLMLLVSV